MPKGFTLLEFLITVAIMSIIGVIAFPSIQNFYNKFILVNYLNSLNKAFYFTRSQAILLEENISICIFNQKNHDCGSILKDGFIIFNDKNNDNHFNDDEEIISKVDQIKTSIKSSHTSKGIYTFNPDGQTNIGGNITICIQNHAGKVVFSPSGRITTKLLTTCEI